MPRPIVHLQPADPEASIEAAALHRPLAAGIVWGPLETRMSRFAVSRASLGAQRLGPRQTRFMHARAAKGPPLDPNLPVKIRNSGIEIGSTPFAKRLVL